MWEEQWARVQRSFAEFKRSDEGRLHDRPLDLYEDEMLHFFQDCYHLKDWLRSDPAVSTRVRDVETAISNSMALSLCADLANATKHLTLTRSRTGDTNTTLGRQRFAIDTTLGHVRTVILRYEVYSGGSTWDAFNIAESCIREWEQYLRSKGLVPQQPAQSTA